MPLRIRLKSDTDDREHKVYEFVAPAVDPAARQQDIDPPEEETHTDQGFSDEEEIEFCLRMLDQNPMRPEVLARLGIALVKHGKLEPAEQALRDALGIDPTCAIAHYGLGIVFDKLGRREDAAQSLSQAVLLDVHYAEIYFAVISPTAAIHGIVRRCSSDNTLLGRHDARMSEAIAVR